jgi:hypothetical protein
MTYHKQLSTRKADVTERIYRGEYTTSIRAKRFDPHDGPTWYEHTSTRFNDMPRWRDFR